MKTKKIENQKQTMQEFRATTKMILRKNEISFGAAIGIILSISLIGFFLQKKELQQVHNAAPIQELKQEKNKLYQAPGRSYTSRNQEAKKQELAVE